MAPLFDPHHPWVFTFGILGNIVSFLVYFAPLPAFIQIYKSKSTLGFHSVPYVVSLFSAMLWMYYAFLKKDAILMITINSFGCIIETIYITIFLIYASKDNRKKEAKLFVGLNVVLFSSILLFTVFLIKGRFRLQVVGWICVAIAVSVFAAPLSILLQVIKTKSVQFLPFNLSFFLTLNAIMWFFYGLLQKDWCIALPNVLGFFLGLVQMLLYGIYRNPTKKVGFEKEKGMQEHVINIGMVGNSSDQVHPMDSAKSGSCDNKVVVEVGKKVINGKIDEDVEVRQERISD